jgi:hypothetical protein
LTASDEFPSAKDMLLLYQTFDLRSALNSSTSDSVEGFLPSFTAMSAAAIAVLMSSIRRDGGLSKTMYCLRNLSDYV